MIEVALIADEPPRRLMRHQRSEVVASVRRLLKSRRLIWALTRRDFTARYKQTVLGLGWALLLPLVTVLVFGVFFQRVVHSNTHGVPYVLWSYLGLLPWTFFAASVNIGGLSLLSNQSLLNKVFSARQIYPIAGVLLAGLDALISLAALTVIFVITGVLPALTSFWVPLIVLVNVVFTIGSVLMLSIFIVYVRDLKNIVPILLQLGLFATPVLYGLDQIASTYRLLYCFLNPIAPVIDSYRRVVLYDQNPQWSLLGAGAVSSLVVLAVGCWVFARFERGIVDII